MLLSVREAAALIGATERQIYRWTHDLELPLHRDRGQDRLHRVDLLEWAVSHRLPVALDDFDLGLDSQGQALSLAQALARGEVHQNVAGAERESAVRAAVSCITLPANLDRGFVQQVLAARRTTLWPSTPDGVALPHVRQPIVAAGAAPAASVIHFQQPIDFGSSPLIRTLVILVTPTVQAHLDMLVRVARLVADPEVYATLSRRAPTDELVAVVARFEARFRVAPSAPTAVRAA